MTKPGANPLPIRQPSRRTKYWLLAGLLALVLGVMFWSPISGYAQTGASYGARVACSCRFVGGRELGQCKDDFEPGMELVTLSEDAQAKSVTARFALVYSQTATFHEGEGCVLEKWDD